MKFEEIKNKVNAEYGTTKIDIETIKFTANEDNFLIVDNGDNFTIYAVTDDGDLLPGFKTAKTIKAITKFVNARA